MHPARAVALLGVTRCLLEVQFWFPLWLVFLLHRGFDLTIAVLADGLFRIVSVLAEIPMGVLADRLGRKRTHLLLCALTAMTFGGVAMVSGVTDLMAVWALWGIQWALNSGASTSYLYELGQQLGVQRAPRAFALVRGAGQAAVLLSLLSAGWIYAIDPSLPFLVTAGLALLAAILTLWLPDVETTGPRPTLRSTVAAVRTTLTAPVTRAVIVVASWFLFVAWSVRILHQPLALELGLGEGATSAMYALAAFVEMLAAVAAGWVATRHRAGVVAAMVALTVLSCLATWAWPTLGPWLWLPALSLAWGLGWTIMEYEVSRCASPAIRATLLSLVSMLAGVGIALARPGLGIVGDRGTVPVAFLCWAGVALAVGVLMARALRRMAADES